MDDSDSIRNKIIGLGDKSWKKSYYPELRLRLNQLELLRSVLEKTSDLFLLLQAPLGIIEESNAAVEEFFSKDVPLKGKKLEELLTPEQYLSFNEALTRESGESRFNLTLRDSKNRERTIEFRMNLKVYESKNWVIALGRDISEGIRYQNALQEGEERLDLALKGGGLGLWDLHLENDELITNETWYTMLGYEPFQPEPSFSLWQSLVHPEDLKIAERQLNRHLSGEIDFYEAEVRMKTFSGGWKWVYTRGRVSLRGEDGTPLRISGTHLDIHQRKTLDERVHQVQRMESIGRLAGGIAHDFNNLLAVILMETEVMEETLPPEYKADLEAIAEAADRGAHLTNQLLAFSKRQKVQKQSLDLNQLIMEMESMMSRLMGSEISLELDLDSTLPELKADKGQFEQVLMNLLVNARDALSENPPSREKKIRIRTRWVRRAPPESKEDLILLEVKDWGKGMDGETERLIYDPFFTTKGEKKGTGLGLATVYGIVTQSGGNIDLKTKPGKGTRFRISLPLQ